MRVCMHVCIYVYTCVCLCTCVCLRACVYITARIQGSLPQGTVLECLCGISYSADHQLTGVFLKAWFVFIFTSAWILVFICELPPWRNEMDVEKKKIDLKIVALPTVFL